MSSRIDIAVRESGADAVTRAVDRLADTCQKLSPTLAKSLRGRALRLGVNLERTVKDAAIAILDTVVHDTPHDTGEARANYVVNVSSSLPAVTPTKETDYDGDATVAKGIAIIQSTKRQPGENIFISNSAPHIKPLNEGWSQQAPAGFVEKAVQKGASTVRKAQGELLK